jgi:hypothetical protein
MVLVVNTYDFTADGGNKGYDSSRSEPGIGFLFSSVPASW